MVVCSIAVLYIWYIDCVQGQKENQTIVSQMLSPPWHCIVVVVVVVVVCVCVKRSVYSVGLCV